MRIALISDIHGNLAALDAVLADIARHAPDKVICLGDVAANGPHPREVLERVNEASDTQIMGNTDAFCLLSSPPTLPDHIIQRRQLEYSIWSMQQLSDADRNIIRSFQPYAVIDTPAGQLIAYHGSPRSDEELVLPESPDPLLAMITAPYPQGVLFAGGHTHQPMLRHFEHRMIMNPGSVGLAWYQRRDGTLRSLPYAQYALLEIDTGIRIHFRQLEYDVASHFEAMQQQAVPHADYFIGLYD